MPDLRIPHWLTPGTQVCWVRDHAGPTLTVERVLKREAVLSDGSRVLLNGWLSKKGEGSGSSWSTQSRLRSIDDEAVVRLRAEACHVSAQWITDRADAIEDGADYA